MTIEQAKSELMQIYGMLSEEKKQAIDVLMAQNCDQCEVGNPCLYCEHEFKAKADRNEFYNWDAPIRHKADREYIPKQAVLENIDQWYEDKADIEDLIVRITYMQGVAIPSAEPKTGHWIVHPKGIYAHLVCDKCLSNAPYDCHTNYCPNCGAKMVEPQEGGDQE